MNNKLGAIILAAGQGKRMDAGEVNKVTLLLRGKPIILRIVEFMRHVAIDTVVVVVGHAKESVERILENKQVIFVEQAEQLGTGHAVQVALAALPELVSDVFVVYGDDAVFYSQENMPYIQELFETHHSMQPGMSMLTIQVADPKGLGRIVRDERGEIRAIVEEKDATPEQKLINEINPGCFVFSVEFLRTYLPRVERSPVTGEYYLTSLIDIALAHGERVETVRGGRLAWRGVNTPEELEEAESLVKE